MRADEGGCESYYAVRREESELKQYIRISILEGMLQSIMPQQPKHEAAGVRLARYHLLACIGELAPDVERD